MLYSLTSHDLTISVVTSYQDDLSSPEDEHYVWSYNVRVENISSKAVQIISRVWKVIDAIGREENIIAPGIIGPAMGRSQPILPPGKSFEHSSEAHLTTPSAIVIGSYHVKFEDSDEILEITVPPFSLDKPNAKASLH